MPLDETQQRLTNIPEIQIRRNEVLARHTRFGIGGPADLMVTVRSVDALTTLLAVVDDSGLPWLVLGGGTNLVVSDDGYRGVVVQYAANGIRSEGARVYADAGADLQDVVDCAIARGLAGIHTMTGIPGWFGAAVYGNAGAYGRAVHQSVTKVTFLDRGAVRDVDNAACQFRYRESVFKQHKEWVILSAELELEPGDAAVLKAQADEIRAIRDAKYPPTMKCAGSIFKNLLFKDLPSSAQAEVPEKLVRDGKVPSAWFLEQTGAKGLGNGGIHVADYHANLIYNAGGGTARQLVEVICELKARVRQRFGFDIEEEVQYVGFKERPCES